MRLDLAAVTAADFSARLGQTFRVEGEGAGLLLTLAGVQPFATPHRPGGGFSLIFEGPAAPCLPQAIHPLTHPEMGTAGIFLVPIQPPPGRSLYEAVFG